jgi:ABC-type branched-subunit amino acid transport system substrate-binding protein
LALTRECREAIKQHSGEALGFVNFEGCVTAKVMLAALERAGKEPTRSGLIASLHGMSGLDLGGMKFGFAADNHQASNLVFLTHIRDGRISKLQ